MQYLTLPASPRLAAFCFSPLPGFHFTISWCLQVPCTAEAASAGGHWAGLAPSHQAWEGTGRAPRRSPGFLLLVHVCWDCSMRANARLCGCGLCVHARVFVCCCQRCAWWRPRYGDQACPARRWRWPRGRSDLPLQLAWHEGLQSACGCFSSCRNWGAASAGLVAAFHLPWPAVGAGSVLPPSILPCPWHTSSMQEVHVLSLAALLCKHSHGCPD